MKPSKGFAEAPLAYWILVAFFTISANQQAMRTFPDEVSCQRALVEFNEHDYQKGVCLPSVIFDREGE